MKRWLAACCVVMLAACATPATAPELVLRLAPAALQRDLALQQRMTVTAHGRTHQMDVAVEADAQAVRLVVLDLGQAVARLEWDGRELHESRAAQWPAQVTGARVLGDLQLVHWPVDAVRAALPVGWTLEADARGRTLRYAGTPVVRVRYPAPGIAELDHLAAGYRVRLESAGAAP